MSAYQRVLVKDTDHFAVQNFPVLEASVFQLGEELKNEPLQEVIDMVLSFVEEHRLNGKLADEHLRLALRITSGALPLRELESLFEASKNNAQFKQESEEHITKTLEAASVNS